MSVKSEGVEEEITLPGVVGTPGGPSGPGGGSATSASQARVTLGAGLQPEAAEAEPATDEEEQDIDLDTIEETITERLLGLTEMLPDKFWVMFRRSLHVSYWFVRRSGWVLGSSLALLALPPFLEFQRVEIEEMQNMQKKQMLLGPGQSPMPALPGGPR